jgi:hypothetical protein
VPLNQKIERLLGAEPNRRVGTTEFDPTLSHEDKWIEGLEISALDLGEYSPYGYTYLSEIIRAGKLPLLAKNAPEAIGDPAIWVKPNRPNLKAAPGGNSLHEAAGIGHMLHVPDNVKTGPNLLTVDRWTMNVFNISARRGELHHLPERTKTKDNLMAHTIDYCTSYLFSASEGVPEQIPRDQWTGDVLFFATQNGLSTMSVLRDRNKMHLLLGLDFEEKYKPLFGEWWGENEEFKKEMRLAKEGLFLPGNQADVELF